MINFLNEDFDEIEKYFIEDINSVDIIDIVKIDKHTVGKFDMLMLSKYGYKNREYIKRYIPLILSFNNISDITEIVINTIIKFPDLESLIYNLQLINIFVDDNVPGINKISNNFVESENYQNSQNSSGLPKLNIELSKVFYDSEIGTLNY